MKKKASHLHKFSPDWGSLLSGFLLLLGLSNIVLIVFVEFNRTPKQIHHFETITTNHVIVVTNYISSASSSDSSAFTVTNDYFSASASIPYQFFFFNRRPYITISGYHFGLHSPTSFGRILEIYPDRFLTDRGWVQNSSFGFSAPNSDLSKLSSL